MKIAVRNNKNTNHIICRFNGQRVTIQPNETFIIETEDEKEYSFWQNLTHKQLDSYGLTVLFDDNAINKNSDYVDNSIVDGFVSPIAKEIASVTVKKPEVEPEITADVTASDPDYTEENLLKMAKEDLFNICDNFGIKYKRNNSVKTLVGLIIKSGVV